MSEKEIRAEIEALKTTLTGNLFEDLDTQQNIYNLKVMLKPEIIESPEQDDDECLSCGA